jgi:chromate transport protein ChrA
MNDKRASQNVQLSLGVILAGVGGMSVPLISFIALHLHRILTLTRLVIIVATVSDLEMNMVGSIFATIAIIFTTLAQIYTSTRQKELGNERESHMCRTPLLLHLLMDLFPIICSSILHRT